MTMPEPFLSPEQIRTLQAAVDRVIPPDDFPGGWEAGVGDFLLALWAQDPDARSFARHGLDLLDAAARRTQNGTAFADLAPDAQDVLLRRIEAERADAAPFFHRLVDQCLEGFYADPGNGGNRNGVSWAMLGYRVTT